MDTEIETKLKSKTDDQLFEMLNQLFELHKKVKYFVGGIEVEECQYCADNDVLLYANEHDSFSAKGHWPCETIEPFLEPDDG